MVKAMNIHANALKKVKFINLIFGLIAGIFINLSSCRKNKKMNFRNQMNFLIGYGQFVARLQV